MDVITNALEGVKQYFQGLPTASGSTASPTYPQPTQATSQSNHDRSSVPYWPPHHDSRVVHDGRPKDVIPQRPSSHSETNSRPPSHQSVPHEANGKNQQPQTYYTTNTSTSTFVDNGQYLHGYQGRDASGPQYQQSSHILPNPSYQQRPQQNQRVQEIARQRPQEENVSYHQMQVPTHSQANYYQNHRSYYKSVTSNSSVYNNHNNNKTVATSQHQIQYNSNGSNAISSNNAGMSDGGGASYKFLQQQQHQSNSTSQASSVMINNYNNSANNQTNQTTSIKDNLQPYQQVKTGHNLPPIASLSNYAGYKPKTAIKNKVLSNSTLISTSASTLTTNNSKLYTASQMRSNMEMPQQQSYRNVGQQYHPSYVNSNHSSSYQQHYQQQSSNNLSQALNQQGMGQQNFNQQNITHQSSTQTARQQLNHHHQQQPVVNQQSVVHQQPNSQIQMPTIKNEYLSTQISSSGNNNTNSNNFDSVLDLSLKTIKTPADSTLDDNNMISDDRNQAKYLQMRMNNSKRYDQRSNVVRSANVTSAPKVDFTPNFNRPLTHSHTTTYNSNNNHQDRRSYQYQNHQQITNINNNINHSNNVNSYPPSSQNHRYASNVTQNYSAPIQNNQVIRKESLPRIDFPSSNQIQKSQGLYVHQPDQRKRLSTESIPQVVQNKKPKVEEKWRQAIDKQIEQKFSLYQNKNATVELKKQPVVNGNLAYHSSNQYQHQNRQYQMNQTYVPSAVAHQYPQSHIPQSHHQGIYQQQHQQNLHRSNSQSSINRLGHQNNAQGADKRVISILRSNLEMKGAKEAQRKLDQKIFNNHPSQREVQQPSTDVMAPLQPKPSLLGRQNVSPFTASSLVERSTPPISAYKFPKAIDSIRFELDEKPGPSTLGAHQSDLDGLAANLAARIRTKGELKQMQQTHIKSELTPAKIEDNFMGSTPSTGSPPKLTKEKLLCPPRRRLFNRPDDDQTETSILNRMPPRDRTGLRSSSETSVFDFPDSDSDTEMPVLERQSLEDMRRDRKSTSKLSVFEEEKLDLSLSGLDDTFDKACDNFMEQLKIGGGKKRGRRKKIECEVIAKLQNFDENAKNTENIMNVNNNNNNIEEIGQDVISPEIKIEKVEIEEESDYENTVIIQNEEQKSENLIKMEVISEIRDVATFRTEIADLKEEIKIPQQIKDKTQKIKKELNDSSDSEDESQSPETKERKKRMQEQIKKSQQLFALRNLTTCLLKPPKKPTFGDGSDFYPGWEEELYKYKKSLRIPDNLIHVTRPPNCQRLSTSLPDLDPCPSPTTSSIIDDFKFKKKENYDSDIDSNCSFNFSLTKNYDSEEGSSVKSVNISKSRDSILDKLVERYSVMKQKRRVKKKEDVPKIIPKSENPLELLPTPSLDVEALTEKKKSGTIIKTDSVFLGFRKKTVENFKDTFINTSNIVGVSEQFTPVVLKSRTRKETRVLKQKATIREVFGEDRPASAPPVTCVDELKDLKNVVEEKLDSTISPKEVLKNKLLSKGKKINLLKDLGSNANPEDNNKQIDMDTKSETPSLDGDETMMKKRSKFRNIRRKGSSGFDYIRKKKKQVKKEEPDTGVKQKRSIIKANPESVQDIQKEIKMWVLNKGIGESHLHRSARLGYTDITAYCLEKMDCSPSPKDNAGYTPLHEACSRGHLSTAKLLLMYGANVSESAQGGIRPLHEAIENGFVEIVRLLLAYGADPMLATYAGVTPLSLATEEQTKSLLENHIKEIQGQPSEKWFFNGPASCFDPEESGYDPLEGSPESEPISDDDLEEMDFEVSDVLLPNLYTLNNESSNDRWVLLQDLSNLLKIKSKDALLKQINPPGSAGNKSILRELKMSDFLEQARCCQFLNAGEKINPRASKIALIKYTDKVKELLNIEKVTIPAR